MDNTEVCKAEDGLMGARGIEPRVGAEKEHANSTGEPKTNDGEDGQETTRETVLSSAAKDVARRSPEETWQAWLVLLAAFVATMQTYGLINSFGIYQTFYEVHLLSHRSSSDISWIGSLQASLLSICGIVSGPLYDRGYANILIIGGMVLVIGGMFATSFCDEYWQVILAQGIAVGLGCGLLFLPTAAILSMVFSRRRALATGIMSVGSPIGGIVFPIIFSRLQPILGFAWTTRVIAFILLGAALIPLLFLRPLAGQAARKSQRGLVDKTVFSDTAYLLFAAAALFTYLGLYVPLFYIQLYAIRNGIGVGGDLAAYFLTLINAGSVLGRLLPNYYADDVGSLNLIIVVTFGAAVLAFGWLGVRNLPGIIVFALLYGFFNGGVTSLTQSSIVALTPDLTRLGTRFGMLFVVSGLSVLIGNPIAGAILGDTYDDARWRGLIAFAAATLFAGFVFFFLSWFHHVRQKRKESAQDRVGR